MARIGWIWLVLLGCAEPAERAVPQPVNVAETERSSDEPAEPELHQREAPAQDTPPALDDGELDAMDEPALEAACFAGSTAACDRLGH